MKKVLLYILHVQYVNENPDTNILSTSEKLKVKIHLVNMIPFAWRSYVSKEIIRLNKKKII